MVISIANSLAIKITHSPHAPRRPWPDAYPGIELGDLGTQQVDGMIVVHLAVKNNNGEMLHATTEVTKKGTNLLSWRFVSDGNSLDASQGDWLRRELLPVDVAGDGMTAKVTFFVPRPEQPGTYRLQVSMVSELRFWMHDRGMKVLTFGAPLVIK